jgi:hypothetical protein
MQQGVNNNQVISDKTKLNANALMAKGPQNKASFASELQSMQNANALMQEEAVQNEALAKTFSSLADAQDPEKFKAVLKDALAQQGIDLENLSPEMKEKLALMQDAVKQEALKRQSSQESLQEAQEVQNKFSTDETTMATASQENQKQITDAIKEGNAAEQEQAQSQDEQRNQQLANWEDLAPRLVEDAKNRAVRIDIPGLPQLETLIVKMQGSAVTIQAVGDKKIMQKLQAYQGQLGSKLSSKDIALADLKTFDRELLNKAKGQGKG